MEYVLLIVGFGLLIKGADFFVDGASSIAKFLKIPPILIGLTVVAFGTSAPEAAVSITAALRGSGSIALGNIIGSNIFNASLIIGITALIFPLMVQKPTIIKEIPFALLASIVLLVMMADQRLQGFRVNSLTRADGIILLGFFGIFMYYVVEVAINGREKAKNEGETTEGSDVGRKIIYTLLGLTAIVFGGELVVKNSIEVALAWGMSEALVGLTIVAVGTSLPELVTSITAALKKESEIALGNVIGSNIFNILFVLGISSTISPVMVEKKVFFDALIMILTTIVLLLLASSNKKVSRGEGIFLAIIYLAYIVYIIIRN